MRQLVFTILTLLSTPCFGQTTISKEYMWRLLTTSYDSLGNDYDANFSIERDTVLANTFAYIDYANWSTSNQDSAFFNYDTITFYRNPDFRFCDYSIEWCHTVKWNFYLNPYTQTESRDYRHKTGGLLMNGTDRKINLKLKIMEQNGNIILSVKPKQSKWMRFTILSIESWTNEHKYTTTELKLLKVK